MFSKWVCGMEKVDQILLNDDLLETLLIIIVTIILVIITIIIIIIIFLPGSTKKVTFLKNTGANASNGRQLGCGCLH